MTGKPDFGDMKFRNVLKVFANLGRKNVYHTALKMNITYSHFLYIMKMLDEKGLVTNRKVGRERLYRFTESGRVLRDLLKRVEEVIKNAKKG